MMITEICKHSKCTGCSACSSACPKQCISMQADMEGFLHPVIDHGKCVECGKCQRICPINNEVYDDEKKPETFAVRNKDAEVLAQSSSGGLFSALAHYTLKHNGAVIGACFDENYRVVHRVCTDISKVDELRRSKYVQSEIGTTYRNAKQLLDDGNMVLFCGTPCQVGGLRAYLEKEYEKLFTIDFICHGVPSPMAWERYKDFMGAKPDKLKKVTMRSKRYGWKKYSMDIEYCDGTIQSNKVNEDLYLRSFIMDLDLRLSCYECQFKQVHRISDITMADFWGSEKAYNIWNDDKGISLAMIHSEKGKELLNQCGEYIDSFSVPFDDAIASNPSMIKSVSKQYLRKPFLRTVKRFGFDKAYAKCCGNGYGAKIRRVISIIRRCLS